MPATKKKPAAKKKPVTDRNQFVVINKYNAADVYSTVKEMIEDGLDAGDKVYRLVPVTVKYSIMVDGKEVQ